MAYGGGNKGSNPGKTFQPMRRKARAGKLRGKRYPGDGLKEFGSVPPERRSMLESVRKFRDRNQVPNAPLNPPSPHGPQPKRRSS